ncbi:hypothetical protein AALO_G00274300, partial [Alosa alosa]
MWPHVIGTRESTNLFAHFPGLRDGMAREMMEPSLERSEHPLGGCRQQKSDVRTGPCSRTGPFISPIMRLCGIVGLSHSLCNECFAAVSALKASGIEF